MTNASDTQKLVDKITEWVKGQGVKQPTRAVPWSWIVALVVAVIAVLAVGIMYWRAWRQGKELARLKHERDVTKQEIARAEVADRVAHNEAEANKLLVTVAKADKHIATIDDRLQEVADAKTRTDEAIDALKNWRDVDRYLSGDGNGGG